MCQFFSINLFSIYDCISYMFEKTAKGQTSVGICFLKLINASTEAYLFIYPNFLQYLPIGVDLYV